MNKTNNNLRIGLEENFYHSFKRGYELHIESKNNQDAWLLKESIIWIQHGIEIGLKLLLIQTNEYLIFANINDAINKFEKLVNIKPNATIIDVFEEDDSPHSIGCEDALKRARIMLGLEELKKGDNNQETLGDKILNLNKYRNRINHFSVQLNTGKSITLLGEIITDFLSLLERNIKNQEFTERYIPEIRYIDSPMRSPFTEMTKGVKNRILNLIKLFDNQKVSGDFFDREGQEICLPKFKDESLSIIEDWGSAVIILAETLNEEKWIIFIQTGFFSYEIIQFIWHNMIINLAGGQQNFQGWLVNFVGNDLVRKHSNNVSLGDNLRRLGVLISNQDNIQKLEEKLTCKN
ncbi:MAG: hypothetical protein V7K35_18805 [Nostoc sp.]|uniref:hypothetical protein n=1 Tax=Nostoc sp. TaxID=1180 RepID=UPI002FF5A5D5